MRRLTNEERMALVEVGEPGEGPVSKATFDEMIRLGYGEWRLGERLWDRITRQYFWCVTAKGRAALELDTIAKAAGG